MFVCNYFPCSFPAFLFGYGTDPQHSRSVYSIIYTAQHVRLRLRSTLYDQLEYVAMLYITLTAMTRYSIDNIYESK